MSKEKSISKISFLEGAALTCFVMGFAMYVAVDAGFLKVSSFGKSAGKQPGAESLEVLERPTARVARIKALHDQIEDVEAKMSEKVVSIGKMSNELQLFESRLAKEKKSLNSISGMVLEIENSQTALKKETKSAFKNRKKINIDNKKENVEISSGLNQEFSEIADVARLAGVQTNHLGSIEWNSKSYMRLVDAFEFQENGYYLLGGGLDLAGKIADAIDESALKEMVIVYGNSDSGNPGRNNGLLKERAFVLSQHFKQLLGEQFKVSVSRINNELVGPESVEIWLGKK